MGGHVRADASGLFGLGSKKGPNITLPEILPGQKVRLKAHFTGLPATFVDLSHVHVDPAPVGDAGTAHAASRGSLSLALPITLIAIAIVLGLLRYARRSYERHDDETPGPVRQLQPQ